MRGFGNAWRFSALASCALLILAGRPVRASLIDTTSLWDNKTSAGPFGQTTSKKGFAASTYGQTFHVGPTQTDLTSFSFWVGDHVKQGPLTVEAYIMQWDGSKAVGAPVYISTPVTVSKGGFQQLSFNTGNLGLSANTEYVAVLSTSPFATGRGTHTGKVGYVGSDVYPDGNFVYLNNGSNLGELTTTAWQNAPKGADLAFRAHFTASSHLSHSPAPSGFLLGALGSCGLLGCAWRGRRKRK